MLCLTIDSRSLPHQKSVGLDTLFYRGKCHGMVQHPSAVFTHKAWKPSELERLSGLSPGALRDLRRRKLAPDADSRKMSLLVAAQLFLQSELVKHGFGPKSVKHIAEAYASEIVAHALRERVSWSDEGSHRLWSERPDNKPEANFLILKSPEFQAFAIDGISELTDIGDVVITLVDLRSLGKILAGHLAGKPSSATAFGPRET